MKEALKIMRESGKGFVKVTKEGAVWTDGRILVLDSDEFNLPEGEYSYQKESGSFIPGKMPDYEVVLPKEPEEDYLEVKPVMEHGYLKLLKIGYKKKYVVSLAGNGIEKHIRYLFFKYLNSLICCWKTSQGKKESVLCFVTDQAGIKHLKAVVMPIHIDL